MASFLACAQRLATVAPTWSPALELPSLAALPARLARPFGEPVELIRGDVRSSAGNCAELLAARARHASPRGDRDLAIERDEGARCIALEQLLQARGAPAGELANFDLRTAGATRLPPTLAVPFGKGDDARAQAAEARGQTLHDYLPSAVVQAHGEALVIKGATWETRVEVLARGDFDGGGREEMLLAAHDQATEGTFEGTRLLLVALRGGDGALTTLKRLQ